MSTDSPNCVLAFPATAVQYEMHCTIESTPLGVVAQTPKGPQYLATWDGVRGLFAWYDNNTWIRVVPVHEQQPVCYGVVAIQQTPKVQPPAASQHIATSSTSNFTQNAQLATLPIAPKKFLGPVNPTNPSLAQIPIQTAHSPQLAQLPPVSGQQQQQGTIISPRQYHTNSRLVNVEPAVNDDFSAPSSVFPQQSPQSQHNLYQRPPASSYQPPVYGMPTSPQQQPPGYSGQQFAPQQSYQDPRQYTTGPGAVPIQAQLPPQRQVPIQDASRQQTWQEREAEYSRIQQQQRLQQQQQGLQIHAPPTQHLTSHFQPPQVVQPPSPQNMHFQLQQQQAAFEAQQAEFQRHTVRIQEEKRRQIEEEKKRFEMDQERARLEQEDLIRRQREDVEALRQQVYASQQAALQKEKEALLILQQQQQATILQQLGPMQIQPPVAQAPVVPVDPNIASTGATAPDAIVQAPGSAIAVSGVVVSVPLLAPKPTQIVQVSLPSPPSQASSDAPPEIPARLPRKKKKTPVSAGASLGQSSDDTLEQEGDELEPASSSKNLKRRKKTATFPPGDSTVPDGITPLSSASLPSANASSSSLPDLTSSSMSTLESPPTVLVDAVKRRPAAPNAPAPDLSDGGVRLSEAGVRALPDELTVLDIPNANMLTADSVQDFPRGLEVLIWTHNTCLDPRRTYLLPRRLTYLDLADNTQLDDHSCHSFPHTLTYLNLSSNNSITNEGMTSFKKLVNLQTLYLSSNSKITASSFDYLPRSLTHLNLNALKSMADHFIPLLPKGLKRLELGIGEGITSTAISQLTNTFGSLEQLDLSNNKFKGDVIPLFPRRLHTLKIGRCKFEDSDPAEGFPPNLTCLNIHSSRVSAKFILRLPSSIKDLDIGKSQISGSDLTKIASHFPELKALNISRVKVSDSNVRDIPRSLTRLDLSENDKLTDASIGSLPPELLWLDLGSTQLTESCAVVVPRKLEYLRLGTPKLNGHCIVSLPRSLTFLDVSATSFKTSELDRYAFPSLLKCLVVHDDNRSWAKTVKLPIVKK